MEGEGLAVGEETAADGGAVLGGFTVAVEEVEFVFLGFGNWGLRRHFYVLFFLLSFDFFHHNSSASSFSLVTQVTLMLLLTYWLLVGPLGCVLNT